MRPREVGRSRIASHTGEEGKRCNDVRTHWLMALTLVLRKILEKVLLSDIHGQLGDLDEGQSGLRKKGYTLDLVLGPDAI